LADAAGFPLLRLFFLKDLFDNGVGLVHPIWVVPLDFKVAISLNIWDSLGYCSHSLRTQSCHSSLGISVGVRDILSLFSGAMQGIIVTSCLDWMLSMYLTNPCSKPIMVKSH
jgi:hypothetical protein